MSATTETVASAPSSAGFLPKLGSLMAFVPLGVWTTLHLWENLSAWQGPQAWQERVASPHSTVAEVLTSVLVLGPLVLHAAWGMRRLTIVKVNFDRYPTYDNLRFLLQRLTAVGALLFLGAHVWLARLQPQLKFGRHETFADISHEMRYHVPTLVVYLLGTLGISFHLANGLQTGGMTWGYAASPKAMRRMNVFSLAFFALLLTMAWGSIAGLYYYGGLQPEHPTTTTEPAPSVNNGSAAENSHGEAH